MNKNYKKMKKILFILIAISFAIFSNAQITPEFEIGAKGVFSGNMNINSEESSAVSDFSDTQLLLGMKQKLYSNWRSDFVVGLQFPDANSNLGQVFFNNIFIRLKDKNNIIKIGRTTTQNILNEFPTLRDDDAHRFVYALNPFSDGINTERDQYANVLEYTRIINQRVLLSLHGENFYDSKNPDYFKLNALGLSFQYRVPESQKWERNVVQEIGLSFNNYFTDRPGFDKSFDSSVKDLIFSSTFNLKPDPLNFIDLKIQAIQNFGWNEINIINNYYDYTRIKSLSVFGMVRYTNRKFDRPNYQLSLGGGYKSFSNSSQNSNQYILIGNGFYRLGENLDIGLQYRYIQNEGYTKNLFGGNQHRIQLAFVYSFEKVFNKYFGERNSILNLEHGYIR